MSQDQTFEAAAEVVSQDEHDTKQESLVDALFDVGTAWAEYGIGHGKLALEQSAQVLQRTAKALETIQERLKSGAA